MAAARPPSARPRVLFLVTVDTEEEWDWAGPFPSLPCSTRNARLIPGFQSFCRSIGVRPTYLVDYAMCNDEASAGFLRTALALGGCEIGAHLHPWCNPPLEEPLGEETSHAISLDRSLVRRKLRNLTARIEETLGVRPVSFRAGRWGMTGWLLQMLGEEGYKVDSSIFPFFKDICFDYARAPVEPYWPDYADGLASGPQRQILEVPVTSGFNRRSFELCGRLHRLLESEPLRHLHGIGILWRLGILRKVNASPELNGSPEVLSCIRSHLERGHGLVNMVLHSSTLLPGGNPFSVSEPDAGRIQRTIGEALDFLARRADVLPCTLSEAWDLLAGES
ncbi:MAG TPA: polysaccharide deacetylase family protein [Thermoanaerobaculia bacterium]|nr:polysaccharide deacetylase family protein [Thermoanaerobaculia bacterium]